MFYKLVSAIVFLTFSLVSFAVENADQIFYNGKIVTVDKAFTIAEALAVKDGKILAVGTDEQVLKLRGSTSVVNDLEGKMLLPGLIDTHQHTLSAATSEFEHPIPAIKTVADIIDYVKLRAKVTPKGEWIWVRDVFPTRLKEHRFPAKAELDSASSDHPVIFAPFGVSPAVSMNNAALAALSIDKDFSPEHPGDILRDDSGEPTGIVKNHWRYIKDDPWETTAFQDRRTQYRKMMHIYNSVGLTTVVDRNTFAEVAEFYQRIANSSQATVRISLFHALDTGADNSMSSIRKEIKRIAKLPLHRAPGPLVQLVGVKTFSDGGILSGSAYMLEPWGKSHIHQISDPEYRGKLFLPEERLQEMMKTAVREGLQFTAHAVGDGAVTEVVKAYVTANKTVAIKGSRSSITHGNFMSPWVIEKMAEMGVVADIQPAWFYLDSYALLQQFGNERLRYFQPLQSLFKAGVVVAGGSDHWALEDSYNAINPFNPFLGMWITVARKARYVDKPVHPEEGLTRQQALQMYTANAAFALARESDIGSLEKGKLADFVVIDRDILTCPIDAIRETRVLRTYLGGKQVYPRSERHNNVVVTAEGQEVLSSSPMFY